MSVSKVELAQRGQVTIPKALRQRYKLETGQSMSLLDLGGVFVLSPVSSQVDILCDQLRDELLKAGGTLEDMLAELRRMREDDAR